VRKIRERIPSPAMIVACLALTIALSGAGYAAVVLPANSVGTVQLKKNAVTAKKIKRGNVTRGKIAANAINSAKVANGTLLAGDVAPGTFVGAGASAGGDLTGPFGNLQLKPDAVTSAEVGDFGLSNEDIGVLFAQVNADSTIANSSGSYTSVHIGTGVYEVDFGRDISACAFVMTQGEAGAGSASGAITGVTDRAGNANAVFATVRTDANVLVDRAFQLVVVC
jgi:hypothetical protein